MYFLKASLRGSVEFVFSRRPSKLLFYVASLWLMFASNYVSYLSTLIRCLVSASIRYVAKCDRKQKQQLVLDFDLKKGERKCFQSTI